MTPTERRSGELLYSLLEIPHSADILFRCSDDVLFLSFRIVRFTSRGWEGSEERRGPLYGIFGSELSRVRPRR
jgi:hypothetical protein